MCVRGKDGLSGSVAYIVGNFLVRCCIIEAAENVAKRRRLEFEGVLTGRSDWLGELELHAERPLLVTVDNELSAVYRPPGRRQDSKRTAIVSGGKGNAVVDVVGNLACLVAGIERKVE